jgi:hypothetical protein
MVMGLPKRLREQAGRHALVDGIPYQLPVNCENSPALFAVFTIDYENARALMPGNEVHPVRLGGRALLVISVIDYKTTDIGKYIEFSIAIACTHGTRPAPPWLPVALMRSYGTGQFVLDLPVSTEVSVKGGKGIWGMPKHQANLDYVITDRTVSSQYDLHGRMCMRIDIDRPRAWLPFSTRAANYCQFRGMLMKSYIYFRGTIGFTIARKRSARITLGPHPRMNPLRTLDIAPDPVFVAFIPEANGVLDDYFESWFLSSAEPPDASPEGLESVASLGRSEVWLPPPRRDEAARIEPPAARQVAQ